MTSIKICIIVFQAIALACQIVLVIFLLLQRKNINKALIKNKNAEDKIMDIDNIVDVRFIFEDEEQKLKEQVSKDIKTMQERGYEVEAVYTHTDDIWAARLTIRNKK